ncbi:putative kinase [Leptolyngbyaceae cyanobacterium JSC-12]|nr:putative kinase [Leptolyngbyaceae cyanobacterium JSC-12]
MTHLLLLIGLPGSGKSTLAAHLIQDCPKRWLISTDAIRARLYGDEGIQGSWLAIWHEVGQQFRQAVQYIQAGEASQAIYDATNVVRKQRRQAIALARASGFTRITGLWLNTPIRLCVQRNENRDRQVPKEVIYRMNRRLCGAPPSKQEGMDELVELRIGNGERQMGIGKEKFGDCRLRML